MTECPMARSSRERVLLQEMSDVMVQPAVVVTTMNKVGHDRAARRCESADLNMVEHAKRRDIRLEIDPFWQTQRRNQCNMYCGAIQSC